MNESDNNLHARGRVRLRRAWSRLTAGLEPGGAQMGSLLVIGAVGVLGWFQLMSNGVLVMALLGVALFEFEKRVDQGLPLMQVAGLLAVLQWTVGPSLAYGTDLVEGRYDMYVDEGVYFGYAIPGTAAFLAGLLAFGFSMRQRQLLRGVSRTSFVPIGLILFGASLAADFMGARVAGGLAFLFHLLAQLRYVAALYFLLSRHRYRWILTAAAVVPLFGRSAESAMFHDMLLWAGMLFCYWYGTRMRSRTEKWVLLVAAALLAFTIQGIKEEYRSKKWQGQEVSLIGTVVGFWSDRERAFGEAVLSNVIVRLNQGWIISAVMRNVPANEPYADGETIRNALSASLLPRFLAPDKAKAGGQVNFRRFSGLDIADTTSMAISPLGEAYANYGRGGGVVLMAGVGMIMALAYGFCLRFAVRRPDFVFWLPLIFYQAIKAETEFVTILNQMTKGAIVAFGLYWGIKRFFLPQISGTDHAARRIGRRGNREWGLSRPSTRLIR